MVNNSGDFYFNDPQMYLDMQGQDSTIYHDQLQLQQIDNLDNSSSFLFFNHEHQLSQNNGISIPVSQVFESAEQAATSINFFSPSLSSVPSPVSSSSSSESSPENINPVLLQIGDSEFDYSADQTAFNLRKIGLIDHQGHMVSEHDLDEEVLPEEAVDELKEDLSAFKKYSVTFSLQKKIRFKLILRLLHARIPAKTKRFNILKKRFTKIRLLRDRNVSFYYKISREHLFSRIANNSSAKVELTGSKALHILGTSGYLQNALQKMCDSTPVETLVSKDQLNKTQDFQSDTDVRCTFSASSSAEIINEKAREMISHISNRVLKHLQRSRYFISDHYVRTGLFYVFVKNVILENYTSDQVKDFKLISLGKKENALDIAVVRENEKRMTDFEFSSLKIPEITLLRHYRSDIIPTCDKTSKKAQCVTDNFTLILHVPDLQFINPGYFIRGLRHQTLGFSYRDADLEEKLLTVFSPHDPEQFVSGLCEKLLHDLELHGVFDNGREKIANMQEAMVVRLLTTLSEQGYDSFILSQIFENLNDTNSEGDSLFHLILRAINGTGTNLKQVLAFVEILCFLRLQQADKELQTYLTIDGNAPAIRLVENGLSFLKKFHLMESLNLLSETKLDKNFTALYDRLLPQKSLSSDPHPILSQRFLSLGLDVQEIESTLIDLWNHSDHPILKKLVFEVLVSVLQIDGQSTSREFLKEVFFKQSFYSQDEARRFFNLLSSSIGYKEAKELLVKYLIEKIQKGITPRALFEAHFYPILDARERTFITSSYLDRYIGNADVAQLSSLLFQYILPQIDHYEKTFFPKFFDFLYQKCSLVQVPLKSYLNTLLSIPCQDENGQNSKVLFYLQYAKLLSKDPKEVPLVESILLNPQLVGLLSRDFVTEFAISIRESHPIKAMELLDKYTISLEKQLQRCDMQSIVAFYSKYPTAIKELAVEIADRCSSTHWKLALHILMQNRILFCPTWEDVFTTICVKGSRDELIEAWSAWCTQQPEAFFTISERRERSRLAGMAILRAMSKLKVLHETVKRFQEMKVFRILDNDLPEIASLFAESLDHKDAFRPFAIDCLKHVMSDSLHAAASFCLKYSKLFQRTIDLPSHIAKALAKEDARMAFDILNVYQIPFNESWVEVYKKIQVLISKGHVDHNFATTIIDIWQVQEKQLKGNAGFSQERMMKLLQERNSLQSIYVDLKKKYAVSVPPKTSIKELEWQKFVKKQASCKPSSDEEITADWVYLKEAIKDDKVLLLILKEFMAVCAYPCVLGQGKTSELLLILCESGFNLLSRSYNYELDMALRELLTQASQMISCYVPSSTTYQGISCTYYALLKISLCSCAQFNLPLGTGLFAIELFRKFLQTPNFSNDHFLVTEAFFEDLKKHSGYPIDLAKTLVLLLQHLVDQEPSERQCQLAERAYSIFEKTDMKKDENHKALVKELHLNKTSENEETIYQSAVEIFLLYKQIQEKNSRIVSPQSFKRIAAIIVESAMDLEEQNWDGKAAVFLPFYRSFASGEVKESVSRAASPQTIFKAILDESLMDSKEKEIIVKNLIAFVNHLMFFFNVDGNNVCDSLARLWLLIDDTLILAVQAYFGQTTTSEDTKLFDFTWNCYLHKLMEVAAVIPKAIKFQASIPSQFFDVMKKTNRKLWIPTICYLRSDYLDQVEDRQELIDVFLHFIKAPFLNYSVERRIKSAIEALIYLNQHVITTLEDHKKVILEMLPLLKLENMFDFIMVEKTLLVREIPANQLVLRVPDEEANAKNPQEALIYNYQIWVELLLQNPLMYSKNDSERKAGLELWVAFFKHLSSSIGLSNPVAFLKEQPNAEKFCFNVHSLIIHIYENMVVQDGSLKYWKQFLSILVAIDPFLYSAHRYLLASTEIAMSNQKISNDIKMILYKKAVFNLVDIDISHFYLLKKEEKFFKEWWKKIEKLKELMTHPMTRKIIDESKQAVEKKYLKNNRN